MRGGFLSLFLFQFLFWGVAGPLRAEPALPGPAPLSRPIGQRLEKLNEKCEDCHPEIAAEWRASYHRSAYSDPAVKKAIARICSRAATIPRPCAAASK